MADYCLSFKVDKRSTQIEDNIAANTYDVKKVRNHSTQ